MNISFEDYRKALSIVHQYEESQKEVAEIKSDTLVRDLSMSTRLRNGLSIYCSYNPLRLKFKEYYNLTISDLALIPLNDFSKYRCIGKGSIDELISICSSAGVRINP
jgi:hypothetical protein